LCCDPNGGTGCGGAFDISFGAYAVVDSDSAGNDTLDGGANADTLNGDAGSDILMATDDGAGAFTDVSSSYVVTGQINFRTGKAAILDRGEIPH